VSEDTPEARAAAPNERAVDLSPDASAGVATPVIAFEGVTKRYASGKELPVTAVDGISLSVMPGEFVMVTGRSGSGKTTLLNLVSGLTKPTSGQIRLDGADIWKMSDAERTRLRNNRIGFVFQFPSLVPALTVHENVMLPMVFRRDRSESDPQERAHMLLRTVGLDDKVACHPRQLSAGQQQRVVLARSLMNRPEIILADEPSSNLDEATEREIMGLFRKVHESTGVTILMVTHTAQLVAWGTRAVEMASGRVTADRPVTQASA